MTDSTKPLEGDPAPPLPVYFSTLDVADFIEAADPDPVFDVRVYSGSPLEEKARFTDNQNTAILRGANERVFRWVDGAWHEVVPEHEHRWAVPIHISYGQPGSDGERQWWWGYDACVVDTVFCAYPHCPEKP